MHITGTNALVTGGASGLGLATVTALAKSGARVIAVDLPTANTDALAALGDTVEFAPADVTDEAAVTEAVERANAESSLRITVNCAGIGNAVKTVGKNGPFPLAEFEKIDPIREALRADGGALHTRLLRIRAAAALPDDISALRVLDVISWMHGKSN